MMGPLEKAIAELDAMKGADYEADHDAADKVLLQVVPPDVAAAYRRLVVRAGQWPTA